MGAKASVADVLVGAFAAFLAVRAEGGEVEWLALPGNGVAIVVAPSVLELALLCVRAVPLVHARWLLHQCLEILRILADLEPVELDIPHHSLDAQLRLTRLGGVHLVVDLRHHPGKESSDQHEDDDDLHQRETAFAAENLALFHMRYLDF